MMRCRHCGVELQDHVRFCPNCGISIAEDIDEREETASGGQRVYVEDSKEPKKEKKHRFPNILKYHLTPVWRRGMKNWEKAGDRPELSSVFSRHPAEIPPLPRHN